jgi:lipopolysaccharide export system protein LptA
MSAERWYQTKRLKRFTDIRLIGAALAAFCWATTTMGAPDSGSDAKAAPQHPVRIQSEQLVAEMASDTAEFSGAVRVEGDGYTITADRLTIQFQPGSIGRNRLTGAISDQEISRITARGQVRIQTDTLTADAEQAAYEPASGRIWLDPSPAAKVSPAGGRAAVPQRSSAQRLSRPSAARVRVTLQAGAGP